MGRNNSWKAKDPAAMGITDLDLFGDMMYAAANEDARRRRRSSRKSQKLNVSDVEYLEQVEAAAVAEEEESAIGASSKIECPRSSAGGGSMKDRRSSGTKSMHEHLLDIEDFMRIVAEDKETKRRIRRSFRCGA
jgi:hypothetical protein